MYFRWTVLAILVASTKASSYTSWARLNPETGGYEGLSVLVSPDLPASQCPQILAQIQQALTNASRALHTAMNGRLFFHDVNIQVPESWTSKDCHTPLSTNLRIRPHEMDFLIDRDHPVHEASVWTQQSLGCRHHGDFIYVPLSALRSDPLELAGGLMTEWIKYRFGVFDGLEHKERPLTSTHSSQCRALSVESIIKEHPDVHESAGEAVPFQEPAFTFSKDQPPKFVIVLENSQAMDLRNQWDFIRTATKKFIQDLPAGAQVGLVLFNDGAHIERNVERLTDDFSQRIGLGVDIGNRYKLVPTNVSCIRCGFVKAIEALQTSGSTMSASIVIISQGRFDSLALNQEREMLQLSKKHRLQVFSISIPEYPQEDLSMSLERICHSTGGQSFFVPERTFAGKPLIPTYVGLVEAFREIQARATGDGPQLIHEEEFASHDHESTEEGWFVVDRYIGRDTRFDIYVQNPTLNSFIRKVVVQDGRGSKFNKFLESLANFHILSVYDVPFEQEQNIGMNWTYTIDRLASPKQLNGHIVRVTSKSRLPQHESINVRFFTNIDSHSTRISVANPLKMFVEVKLDRVPILGAKVIVTLQAIDHSGYLTTATSIQLLDNGNGDPDLFAKDGIYSRYLTDLSLGEGRYSVTVHVDDNDEQAYCLKRKLSVGSRKDLPSCCTGFGINTYSVTDQKLGSFSRIVKGDSFRIDSIKNGKKKDFPPVRILDLAIAEHIDSQELEFSWTAPGEEFDCGQVTSYRLYQSDDPEYYFGDLSDLTIVEGFSATKPAGEKERHIITVTEFDKTLYYAMVGVDFKGNLGGVSNIREAFMPRPFSKFDPSSDDKNSVKDDKFELSNHIQNKLNMAKDKPDKVILYIISGIVGFIVLCILIVLLIVLRYKRKKLSTSLSSRDLTYIGAGDNQMDDGDYAECGTFRKPSPIEAFLPAVQPGSNYGTHERPASAQCWTEPTYVNQYRQNSAPPLPTYASFQQQLVQEPTYAKPVPKDQRPGLPNPIDHSTPDRNGTHTPLSSQHSQNSQHSSQHSQHSSQASQLNQLLLSRQSQASPFEQRKATPTKSILKKPKAYCDSSSQSSRNSVEFASDTDSPNDLFVQPLKPSYIQPSVGASTSLVGNMVNNMAVSMASPLTMVNPTASPMIMATSMASPMAMATSMASPMAMPTSMASPMAMPNAMVMPNSMTESTGATQLPDLAVPNMTDSFQEQDLIVPPNPAEDPAFKDLIAELQQQQQLDPEAFDLSINNTYLETSFDYKSSSEALPPSAPEATPTEAATPTPTKRIPPPVAPKPKFKAEDTERSSLLASPQVEEEDKKVRRITQI